MNISYMVYIHISRITVINAAPSLNLWSKTCRKESIEHSYIQRQYMSALQFTFTNDTLVKCTRTNTFIQKAIHISQRWMCALCVSFGLKSKRLNERLHPQCRDEPLKAGQSQNRGARRVTLLTFSLLLGQYSDFFLCSTIHARAFIFWKAFFYFVYRLRSPYGILYCRKE